MVLFFAACSRKPDPNTLVMIIESSPTNLDPRVGVDAQSERIDELLFDSLVRRDEHFNLKPWLAESWEIPDPLTYIFHLRHGVRFHNGQPLTARDVKWTFDSLISGKLRSAKTSTYAPVDRIEAPDDYTVVFHLKQPFAPLLWNLSDGAIGIVPYGSGEDFNRHPVGSGPVPLRQRAAGQRGGHRAQSRLLGYAGQAGARAVQGHSRCHHARPGACASRAPTSPLTR